MTAEDVVLSLDWVDWKLTLLCAVAAVVLMGDPSFVKNLSWDRGNASNVSVSHFVYCYSVAQYNSKVANRRENYE